MNLNLKIILDRKQLQHFSEKLEDKTLKNFELSLKIPMDDIEIEKTVNITSLEDENVKELKQDEDVELKGDLIE